LNFFILRHKVVKSLKFSVKGTNLPDRIIRLEIDFKDLFLL